MNILPDKLPQLSSPVKIETGSSGTVMESTVDWVLFLHNFNKFLKSNCS